MQYDSAQQTSGDDLEGVLSDFPLLKLYWSELFLKGTLIYPEASHCKQSQSDLHDEYENAVH